MGLFNRLRGAFQQREAPSTFDKTIEVSNKLCANCKHYRYKWWQHMCARKVKTYFSPITGESVIKTELHLCSHQRLVSHRSLEISHWMAIAEMELPQFYCGKEGRYWEERQ